MIVMYATNTMGFGASYLDPGVMFDIHGNYLGKRYDESGRPARGGHYTRNGRRIGELRQKFLAARNARRATERSSARPAPAAPTAPTAAPSARGRKARAIPQAAPETAQVPAQPGGPAVTPEAVVAPTMTASQKRAQARTRKQAEAMKILEQQTPSGPPADAISAGIAAQQAQAAQAAATRRRQAAPAAPEATPAMTAEQIRVFQQATQQAQQAASANVLASQYGVDPAVVNALGPENFKAQVAQYGAGKIKELVAKYGADQLAKYGADKVAQYGKQKVVDAAGGYCEEKAGAAGGWVCRKVTGEVYEKAKDWVSSGLKKVSKYVPFLGAVATTNPSLKPYAIPLGVVTASVLVGLWAARRSGRN